MKILVRTAGVVLSVCAVAGCGDQREPAPVVNPAASNPTPAPTNNVPDWVNDPTLGGKYPIAAYGVSEKMMAGEGVMRDRAMSSARTEIARSINARVQSIFKDWTREGGEISSQDNKQMAMTMAENISRTVTDQVLTGTSQRGRFAEPGTGKLFVWVYLDAGAMDSLNKQIQAKAREEMEKRAHFASKIEADKAFADLDRLVDAQFQGK
jgi:hypothetical protein